MVWYEQAPSRMLDDPVSSKDVAAAFSSLPSSATELHSLQPQVVQTVPPTALRDLLVPVVSREYLQALQPKRERLEQLCNTHSIDGVHLFVLAENDEGIDAYARNFSLGMTPEGIGEDPATGTLAGALACYLHTRGALQRGVQPIVFHQGPVGHLSELRVMLQTTAGENITNVKIGGRAVPAGKIFIPSKTKEV